MTAPVVNLYANIGSEGVPNWSGVAADESIIYCGSGGTGGMTDLPVEDLPVANKLYTACWKGKSGSYSKVNTYYDDMALNGNQNVFKFTWDRAFAAAPAICFFDNASRVATSQMLAGTAGDTSSTSYVKGCLTDAGISANWCTVTTENGVGQATFNTGQAMQGLSHYLSLANATWNAAGSVTFSVVGWIGPNFTPTGETSTLLTLKYQWS